MYTPESRLRIAGANFRILLDSIQNGVPFTVWGPSFVFEMRDFSEMSGPALDQCPLPASR